MPTKTISIRNVDTAVYARIKSQAAAMGLTLAEWLERAESVMGYVIRASDEGGMTMPEFAKMMLTYKSPKGKE